MVYVPYLNETLGAVSGCVKCLLSSDRPERITKIVEIPVPPTFDTMWLRIAGISGALSVIASAYGAHGFKDEQEKEKQIFKTGAYYHLVHSVALIGSPLARRPHVTATLFLTGMVMFCGSCYYVAMTSDHRFSKIAPIGGITLICAWISLAL